MHSLKRLVKVPNQDEKFNCINVPKSFQRSKSNFITSQNEAGATD